MQGLVDHGAVVGIVDFVAFYIGCMGHCPGDCDSSWCCPEEGRGGHCQQYNEGE